LAIPTTAKHSELRLGFGTNHTACILPPPETGNFSVRWMMSGIAVDARSAPRHPFETRQFSISTRTGSLPTTSTSTSPAQWKGVFSRSADWQFGAAGNRNINVNHILPSCWQTNPSRLRRPWTAYGSDATQIQTCLTGAYLIIGAHLQV
jgi:hypothetical protein